MSTGPGDIADIPLLLSMVDFGTGVLVMIQTRFHRGNINFAQDENISIQHAVRAIVLDFQCTDLPRFTMGLFPDESIIR